MFYPFFERKVSRKHPLAWAQRTLQFSRIKTLADYVLNGIMPGRFYVFPAVTVTLELGQDDALPFEEIEIEDDDFSLVPDGNQKPTHGFFQWNNARYRLWLADGQHRIMALIQAYLRGHILMSDEMVTLQIHPQKPGENLHRKIFLDVNQARTPTKSIKELLNDDDPYATMARQCLELPIFSEKTCLEQTSAKGPDLLFAMAGLAEATRLFAKGIQTEDAEVVMNLWLAVQSNHPDWQKVVTGEWADDGAEEIAYPNLGEFRKRTISFLAVTLNAIAYAAVHQWKEGDTGFEWMSRLVDVDWSVANTDWDGIIKFGGRVVKKRDTEKALARYILNGGEEESGDE